MAAHASINFLGTCAVLLVEVKDLIWPIDSSITVSTTSHTPHSCAGIPDPSPDRCCCPLEEK